ncbi:hypothetical protein BN871_JU_00080 [Paenibacillus sp. P22]|nr:hypothetical protein BN871_JU_00080 [Paenibacillus sp. P22]
MAVRDMRLASTLSSTGFGWVKYTSSSPLEVMKAMRLKLPNSMLAQPKPPVPTAHIIMTSLSSQPLTDGKRLKKIPQNTIQMTLFRNIMPAVMKKLSRNSIAPARLSFQQVSRNGSVPFRKLPFLASVDIQPSHSPRVDPGDQRAEQYDPDHLDAEKCPQGARSAHGRLRREVQHCLERQPCADLLQPVRHEIERNEHAADRELQLLQDELQAAGLLDPESAQRDGHVEQVSNREGAEAERRHARPAEAEIRRSDHQPADQHACGEIDAEAEQRLAHIGEILITDIGYRRQQADGDASAFDLLLDSRALLGTGHRERLRQDEIPDDVPQDEASDARLCSPLPAVGGAPQLHEDEQDQQEKDGADEKIRHVRRLLLEGDGADGGVFAPFQHRRFLWR